MLVAAAGAARPGSLDSTFGSKGIVTTVVGDDAFANAIVAEPDGKLVAAGSSSIGSQGVFALARYRENGSLDKSFGDGGIVDTPIGSTDYSANALVEQPDGKLVVAGESSNGTQHSFALARYESNGSLDPSFGSGGTVTTTIGTNSGVEALVLLPDGKVVAAGYSDDGTQAGEVFALARYNKNGSLDSSFGSGGIVTTPIGYGAEAFALAVNPNGELVAAGYSYQSIDHGDPISVFTLARYKTNGALDSAFGSGGIADAGNNGFAFGVANAIVVLPDGSLFTSGVFNDPSYLRFVHFGARGGIDSAVATSFRVGSDLGARGLVRQRDGLLDAAFEGTSESGHAQVEVARVDEFGDPDPSFGSGGLAMANLGPGVAPAVLGGALAMQPDGKLVAAGSSGTEAHSFALARFVGYQACVVPKLIHHSLREARRLVGKAHCSLGAVTRVRSTVAKGLVVGQTPAAGVQKLPDGYVHLRVSTGRGAHR